jgi:hypothetical protein
MVGASPHEVVCSRIVVRTAARGQSSRAILSKGLVAAIESWIHSGTRDAFVAEVAGLQQVSHLRSSGPCRRCSRSGGRSSSSASGARIGEKLAAFGEGSGRSGRARRAAERFVLYYRRWLNLPTLQFGIDLLVSKLYWQRIPGEARQGSGSSPARWRTALIADRRHPVLALHLNGRSDSGDVRVLDSMVDSRVTSRVSPSLNQRSHFRGSRLARFGHEDFLRFYLQALDGILVRIPKTP